jgi:hypothetical protein
MVLLLPTRCNGVRRVTERICRVPDRFSEMIGINCNTRNTCKVAFLGTNRCTLGDHRHYCLVNIQALFGAWNRRRPSAGFKVRQAFALAIACHHISIPTIEHYRMTWTRVAMQ